MPRLLLLHFVHEPASQELANAIRAFRFEVDIASTPGLALQKVRQGNAAFDLVLLIGRAEAEGDLKAIRELVLTYRRLNHCAIPSFLFVSCTKLDPQLRLRIERMGVRYVRI